MHSAMMHLFTYFTFYELVSFFFLQKSILAIAPVTISGWFSPILTAPTGFCLDYV